MLRKNKYISFLKNNFGGQNKAGAQVEILHSAVRYWIYKVWTAPGPTPIDQSAYRITAEQAIKVYGTFWEYHDTLRRVPAYSELSFNVCI